MPIEESDRDERAGAGCCSGSLDESDADPEADVFSLEVGVVNSTFDVAETEFSGDIWLIVDGTAADEGRFVRATASVAALTRCFGIDATVLVVRTVGDSLDDAFGSADMEESTVLGLTGGACISVAIR